MGIIYKATNIVNGHVYIGKTTGMLSLRMNKHKSDAKNNRYDMYFHRAIRKYGFDSFIWDILAETDSETELNKLERDLIASHRDIVTLYNQTEGGEGISGFKMPEEAKRKLSENHKGSTPWNRGVTHSPETCKRLSEINKGRAAGEKNPMYGVHLCGEKNPMWGRKRPDVIKRNKENNPTKDPAVREQNSKRMKEYWKNNYAKGLISRQKAKETCRLNLLKIQQAAMDNNLA